jgi:hypothetical protein
MSIVNNPERLVTVSALTTRRGGQKEQPQGFFFAH